MELFRWRKNVEYKGSSCEMTKNLKRGVKRTCEACGARFYDLNRDPIICPMCEAVFQKEIPVEEEPEAKDEPETEEETDTDTEQDEESAEVLSLDELEAENDEDIPEIEDEENLDDISDDTPEISSDEDDDTFLEEDEDSGSDVTSIIGTSIDPKSES